MDKNKISKKRKRNAKWDPFSIKILIEVCMDEIRSSGKPGISFADERWEVVANHFNTRANKKYTPKQLKNRMDDLRTDWLIWKILVGKETGIGWNHQTGTIQADATWWEAKIRDNPKCAKFQYQELKFRDDLDFVFGDTVATSQNARTPAMGALIESSDQNIASDSPLEEIAESDDGKFNRDEGFSPTDKTPDKRKRVAIHGTKGKEEVNNVADMRKTLARLVQAPIESSGRNITSNMPLEIVESDDGNFNLDEEFSPLENTCHKRKTVATQGTGARVTKGKPEAETVRKTLEQLVQAPIESSGRNITSNLPLGIVESNDGKFNLEEFSPLENTRHKRKRVATQGTGARVTKGKSEVETVAGMRKSSKRLVPAPIESSGKNIASDSPLETAESDDGNFNLYVEFSPMENANHRRKRVATQGTGAGVTKGKPEVETVAGMRKSSARLVQAPIESGGKNIASDSPLETAESDDGKFNLDEEFSLMENTNHKRKRVATRGPGARVTKGKPEVKTATDMRKTIRKTSKKLGLGQVAGSHNKTKIEDIAATSHVHGQYSIPSCIEVLKTLKGVYLNSQQFSFAIELLKDSQNRVILMSLEDSIDALADWILYKYFVRV